MPVVGGNVSLYNADRGGADPVPRSSPWSASSRPRARRLDRAARRRRRDRDLRTVARPSSPAQSWRSSRRARGRAPSLPIADVRAAIELVRDAVAASSWPGARHQRRRPRLRARRDGDRRRRRPGGRPRSADRAPRAARRDRPLRRRAGRFSCSAGSPDALEGLGASRGRRDRRRRGRRRADRRFRPPRRSRGRGRRRGGVPGARSASASTPPRPSRDGSRITTAAVRRRRGHEAVAIAAAGDGVSGSPMLILAALGRRARGARSPWSRESGSRSSASRSCSPSAADLTCACRSPAPGWRSSSARWRSAGGRAFATSR